MSNLQKQFEKFHENIRLSDKDEKAKLQEKIKAIKDKAQDKLQEKLMDKLPKFGF